MEDKQKGQRANKKSVMNNFIIHNGFFFTTI